MQKTILAALIVFSVSSSLARDDGRWANNPATVRQWFQNLMRPDLPTMSCCGEADAFEADNFDIEGDHYVAVITDGRGLIPSGLRIPVPNTKLKIDKGNPTGHGIIFLSNPTTMADNADRSEYTLIVGNQGRYIYCYVTPNGA